MKRIGWAALVALIISVQAWAQQPQAGSVAAPSADAEKKIDLPPIDKTKLSYALGYKLGKDAVDMGQIGIQLDAVQINRGLQDGFGKKPTAFSTEELVGQIAALEDKVRTEVDAKRRQAATENKAKSDKFLAENKSKKGIVVLPSGIQYRVIEEGNGNRPTATSEVSVHYRGSLSSGLEFDSSFVRNQPASFKVDQVLPGWQEVLPLMRVGDTWQVFLPPEKGFGERGMGPVGPNQALIFEIKLLEVK